MLSPELGPVPCLGSHDANLVPPKPLQDADRSEMLTAIPGWHVLALALVLDLPSRLPHRRRLRRTTRTMSFGGSRKRSPAKQRFFTSAVSPEPSMNCCTFWGV